MTCRSPFPSGFTRISEQPEDAGRKLVSTYGRRLMSEPQRSRQARALAEAALVRIVGAYGETPEFVLLGGLVPDLVVDCHASIVSAQCGRT